jgi:hypothetical protein
MALRMAMMMTKYGDPATKKPHNDEKIPCGCSFAFTFEGVVVAVVVVVVVVVVDGEVDDDGDEEEGVEEGGSSGWPFGPSC